MPVSPSGQISIFSTAATKVIVRLRGWYASAASTVNGARFVPVPPSTVVNILPLAAGGTTTVTGAIVWAISGGTSSCVASTPTVANGILFHGSAGVLVASNAATGAVLYSDSTTPGRSLNSISSVVVANGAVYAAREGLASPGYEAGLTAHHHP